MKSLRILCVGSNLESEKALQGLINHGAPIVGLVTRPSTTPGQVSDYVDLHHYCTDNDIPVINTRDINSPETIKEIKELEPDYIFVLGWSQLFSEELLQTPTKFIVGSHPSRLPEGRGRAPIPWTILQGASKSAVTLFRMDTGIDSGDILWQRSFPVEPDIYAMQLYLQTATYLSTAFCELSDALANDTIKSHKQDPAIVSHRSRRYPEDGYINFSLGALEIDRLIRATSQPYPGAYAYHRGRKIEIWKTSLGDIPDAVGTPGQILKHSNNALLVYSIDQPLWISDFTCNGQYISPTELPVGSCFGYRVNDEIHKLWQAVHALQNNE